MDKKAKGKVAEMAVSAKLMKMGWKILVPLCENTRYDLAAEKNGKFAKVQVKYVTPRMGKLDINCKSSNNWSILPYSTKEIDVLAVYNSDNHDVYFIPSANLNNSTIKLRVAPTKNKQHKGIKFARDFKKLVL